MMRAFNAEETRMRRRLIRCLIVLLIPVFWGAGCAPVKPRLETRFYPPPPSPPRIQFLKKISSSEDVETHSKFEAYVTGHVERRRFIKPYGVAVHEGVIYVCDTRGGDLVVIDMVNQTYERFNAQGAGALRRPINVAIDDKGTKYVADVALKRIMVYDQSDRFIKSFGEQGQFKPVDVAVSKDKLYVLDIEEHEVEILDKNKGELLGTVGEPGAGEGQLFKPTNLTLDREGNLYVTDTLNCRIVKYDPQGDFVFSFGECGDNLGSFVRPKGLAVDENGYIYVVDAAFENVQIFTPEGELALFFGGPGAADVPGALWLPAAIVLDKSLLPVFDSVRNEDFLVQYLVLVTSQFGPPYINVYAFGEARKGTPLSKGEVRAYDEEELKPDSADIPRDVKEESPK